MRAFLYELKKSAVELFSYPVQTLSSAPADYDAYWRDKRGESLGALSPWQKDRADLLLSFMDASAPRSLLDIGCGDGSVLRYAKEHGAVSETTGVDVSPLALSKAAAFGIRTVELDVSRGEWELIPEADYVLMFEVLEHMPSSEAFLKAMLGKAKRGIFFSFPNTGYILHRLRLLFGRFPLQWRLSPGEHLRFWTYGDLRWWMKAQGYARYELRAYRGVPLLNRVWPALFAQGLFVYLPKTTA